MKSLSVDIGLKVLGLECIESVVNWNWETSSVLLLLTLKYEGIRGTMTSVVKITNNAVVMITRLCREEEWYQAFRRRWLWYCECSRDVMEYVGLSSSYCLPGFVEWVTITISWL